jgi:hypothetical protein
MTNPNIPSPPTPSGYAQAVFPSDLLSYKPNATGTAATSSPGAGTSNASSGFYTNIQFVPSGSVPNMSVAGVSSSGGMASPTGGVYLPLPLRINDIELAVWQDASLLDFVPSIATEAIRIVGKVSPGGPVTLNPFLFMLYKQPAFREFVFNWQLAPNNQQESQTLQQILYYFKTAALPEYTAGGVALDYPYLAQIKLNPSQFLFDFKPCVIVSVEIEFAGSGAAPSFFYDGAPTIVNLTAHFKEIEILTRSDVMSRGGTLTQGMDATGAGTAIQNVVNSITSLLP